MDTNERIANFKNSLPQPQREAFDSLLARCVQLHIELPEPLAEEESNTTGVIKLPSFPAPAALPEHFLRELDAHPLVTYLHIQQEADAEMAAWVAGCCQYLGSFLELNTENPTITLRHCHLDRLSIEACVKLLYLYSIMQHGKHNERYFTRFSSAIATAFFQQEQEVAASGNLYEVTFEAWKLKVIQELHLLLERQEEQTGKAVHAAPEAPSPAPQKKTGCLPVMALLVGLGSTLLLFTLLS